MTVTIGPAQMVNWETKRAAVEKPDGGVDLYRLIVIADREAVAKHVGRVLTIKEAELWVNGKAELDIEK